MTFTKNEHCANGPRFLLLHIAAIKARYSRSEKPGYYIACVISRNILLYMYTRAYFYSSFTSYFYSFIKAEEGERGSCINAREICIRWTSFLHCTWLFCLIVRLIRLMSRSRSRMLTIAVNVADAKSTMPYLKFLASNMSSGNRCKASRITGCS
jgi:hypothetical protein